MKQFLRMFNGKLLFICSMLINFILILQFFGNASDELLGVFFRSDNLYLPSIYRDLFIDHNSLNGWNVNPAPNFIPEWPIYFFFNFIWDDFRIASFIYAFSNFFALSLLTVFIIKRAFGEISWGFLSVSNFAFTCFLMLFLDGYDFVTGSMFFLSAYHNGVYIMTLFSVYILFVYLEKGRNFFLPILLLVLSLIGVISDRLFLVFFTIPVLITLVFIRYQSHRKKLLIILSFGTAGALLGLFLFNLIDKGSYLTIYNVSGRIFNFGNTIKSIRLFLEHMQNFYIRGGFHRLILLLSIISAGTGIFLSIRFVFKSTGKSELNLQKLAVVLFTAMILVILFNPIINGTYLDFVNIRYNIFSFYLATSLISVGFYFLSKTSVILKYLIIVGIIFINVAFFVFILRFEARTKSLSHITNVFNYYPESAASVDSLDSNHHLKNGVADYSIAKVITMFSKKDVKVRHVHNNLAIFSHDSNNKWYLDKLNSDVTRTPVFNFIILNNFADDGSIKKIFKTRIDTIISGDIKLLRVPDFYFSPATRQPVVIE